MPTVPAAALAAKDLSGQKSHAAIGQHQTQIESSSEPRNPNSVSNMSPTRSNRWQQSKLDNILEIAESNIAAGSSPYTKHYGGKPIRESVLFNREYPMKDSKRKDSLGLPATGKWRRQQGP